MAKIAKSLALATWYGSVEVPLPPPFQIILLLLLLMPLKVAVAVCLLPDVVTVALTVFVRLAS